MRNLAGDPDCDKYVLDELRSCGIEAVYGERWPGEVAASVTGRLGSYKFRRAWYYWVVEGRVPVEVARELYADPVGAADVRVCGHCGCPSPDEHGADWFSGDGRKLLDLAQKAEIDRCAAGEGALKESAVKLLAECDFAENPSSVGIGFIDLYHIDSEAGLRLFVDTIRRHGLESVA